MVRLICVLMAFAATSYGDIDTWKELDLSRINYLSKDKYSPVYFGDVHGDMFVFASGPACDFTWDIKTLNLSIADREKSFLPFTQNGIDTYPRIDGDIVVWCGGPKWKDPWTHEPSNFSVFARDLKTGVQKTLREYTMSESYSHPAVSGNIVVWLEHLNLDPRPKGRKAKNWWNTAYNICGADISDIEKPVYFTIAKNVGKRDPYPCLSYTSCYDNVIDICGSLVVWEADGDIYCADISDIKNIKTVTICDHKAGQFNPVISGKKVVWTDRRNDDGDIYGADVSDLNNIRPIAIVKERGRQVQPAIDSNMMVYLNISKVSGRRLSGEISICKISEDLKAEKIDLPKKYFGVSPSIDKNTVIFNQSGKATGIRKVKLQARN